MSLLTYSHNAIKELHAENLTTLFALDVIRIFKTLKWKPSQLTANFLDPQKFTVKNVIAKVFQYSEG